MALENFRGNFVKFHFAIKHSKSCATNIKYIWIIFSCSIFLEWYPEEILSVTATITTIIQFLTGVYVNMIIYLKFSIHLRYFSTSQNYLLEHSKKRWLRRHFRISIYSWSTGVCHWFWNHVPRFETKIIFTLYFRCSLWLRYGMLMKDTAMTVVNAVGLVLQLCYVFMYYLYATNKVLTFSVIFYSLNNYNVCATIYRDHILNKW